MHFHDHIIYNNIHNVSIQVFKQKCNISPTSYKYIQKFVIHHFLILPPKSGLKLLSYCCKRLLSRNVTFCTVWTLMVALEEMVVGTGNALVTDPGDSFFLGGGNAFVKWPFCALEITAIPRLLKRRKFKYTLVTLLQRHCVRYLICILHKQRKK